VDIATVVLSIAGSAGGLGTIAYWLETRTSGARNRRKSDSQALINESLESVREDVTVLKTKVEADGNHVATVIKAALYEALDPIKEDITTLKSDTGAMWKSLEQLSVSLAEQMHKPHPENAELDALLDQYMDWVRGDGNFPVEQERKLRSYLKLVKNWRPGQEVGFVVDVGDPTRAATLLATMELTRIRRRQEQK
jgi:hypothetical protein